VAGINGENTEKHLTLDLSFQKNKKGNLIISGNGDEPSFKQKHVVLPQTGKVDITLKANDGFVVVFE
jgi:alpha-glucosidase